MNADARPAGSGTGDETAWQPAGSIPRRREASLRCERMANGRHDPWRFEVSASPRSLEGARSAWAHLRWLGLVDSEGFVDGVLRDLRSAS